ncbi:MAG TPA: YHS domain-containing protein [Bacteroidetes bacterium]|nr:copper-transporting P-type ATPase [bacterium BMS3Bbin04]HDO65524.1 YHS domain-containing protein [Bacteroidota bacterium]HEX04649.1 YHS domain-containing protein [Bacteroidota bacterium]
MKRQKPVRDPVCGRRVNRNRSHMELIYKGKKYFLCCPKCQSEFEANPDQYIREGDDE